jgi:Spy/CpxP family protein refolding chaperone
MTSIRNRHFVAALLSCALVLPALAQTRANFPWWNSPVVSDIGLTREQTQRIRQIVRSYRDRLFDARNNLQKANAALEDMLNDPEVNPDAAKPLIERVALARAQSDRILLDMSVHLRTVLTYDQWRQLVRRWDEMQHKKLSDTQVPPE